MKFDKIDKKEYASKIRTEMKDEAAALYDAGKFEESKDKQVEIAMLDNEYFGYLNNTRFKDEEQANLDKIPEAVRAMYAGSGVDFTTGKHWTGSAPVEGDPLFLNSAEKLVDRVERTSETVQLLNTKNAMGETIRGIVTGKWSSPDLKNAVTTTTSGALIPEILSAQLIDLMRNKCLFTAAGVPVYPMKSNNLSIARIASDPEFAFKAEGQPGTEGSLSFDSVTLNAKTIYGFAYLTIEAVRSAENLDSIVKNAFAEALARAMDKAMLYGQADGEGGFDSFAPAGIWNDENIESQAAGTDAPYDVLIKARGKLLANNASPSCLAINSQTEELLQLQKDKQGRYVQMPEVIAGLQKVVTNQLVCDESAGSDALVFDPKALAIGVQDGIKVEVINDEKALKNGLVGFRIYAMVDSAVLQPKAICKVTGLKEQEDASDPVEP